MRLLVRSYFWWPRIDYVSKVVERCASYIRLLNWQRHFAFLWYFIQKPWSRSTFMWIQTNFVRSFQRNSLIWVDFSKWPQVNVLSNLGYKTYFHIQNMRTRYYFTRSVVNTGTNFIDGFCHALSKHEKWKSVLQED